MNEKMMKEIADVDDLYLIRQQVIEVVEELCLTPVRGTDQALLKDLALDSLRMVMLLVNIEDTFEIELDESDMNPFMLITVGDVVNLVMKYVVLQKEARDNG